MKGKNKMDFAVFKDNYRHKIGKKPLLIFFDAKDTTSNPNINFLTMERHGFSWSMLKTGIEMSKRYDCKVLVGADEMLLIIEHPEDIILKKFQPYDSDIISLMSQEVFVYFNSIYDNTKKNIFFHSKLFCLPEVAVDKYIHYHEASIHNVMLQYFLKRKGFRTANLPYDQMVEKAENTGYGSIKKVIQNGAIIENGKLYDARVYPNMVEYTEDEVYEAEIAEKRYSPTSYDDF